MKKLAISNAERKIFLFTDEQRQVKGHAPCRVQQLETFICPFPSISFHLLKGVPAPGKGLELEEL